MEMQPTGYSFSHDSVRNEVDDFIEYETRQNGHGLVARGTTS